MRRATAIGILAMALACSDAGQGPQGPAGADARLAGTSGTATTCTPGERFCAGSVIWVCSRTGLDADEALDCAGVTSAGNPGTCATDARCGATTPCCTSTLPVCSWTMSSPAATSGDTWSSSADAERCAYSEYAASSGRPAPAPPRVSGAWSPYLLAPRCPGKYFGVQWTKTYDGCPRSYSSAALSIERAVVAPGTIALAAAGVPGVLLRLDRYVQGSTGTYTQDATASCASWTGTVSWISDVPSWRVTLNATCAEAGKSAVRLVATFHGDQP